MVSLEHVSLKNIIMMEPLGLLLVSSTPTASQPKSRKKAEAAKINPFDDAGDGARNIEFPKFLWRYMMKSEVWKRHERGEIKMDEEMVAQLAGLPMVRTWVMELEEANGNNVCESIKRRLERERTWGLTEVPEMVAALRQALVDSGGKQESPPLVVVCVSNMSKNELCFLRRRFPQVFALFATTIISGEEGVSLPSRRFLNLAMRRVRASFHSDTHLFLHAHCIQSITAARSLGLRASILSVSHPLQLHHLLHSHSPSSAPPADHQQCRPSGGGYPQPHTETDTDTDTIDVLMDQEHRDLLAKAIASATHYLFSAGQ